jgi:glycerol-3-phosphate acyltransferase PlsY
MLTAAACILAAYLCGSIATAVWVGRVVRGIDIREHGSGNAGATNVARVVGVPWGLLVGLIDILKGLVPVALLSSVVARGFGIGTAEAGLILGVAAIVGHLYPAFAGFKGGKGVLTALGVSLALLPIEAGIAALVWLGVFAIWRTVSLGSIVATIMFVAATLVHRLISGSNPPTSLVVMAFVIGVLVFVTHRSNIRRLMAGTESRFKRS